MRQGPFGFPKGPRKDEHGFFALGLFGGSLSGSLAFEILLV